MTNAVINMISTIPTVAFKSNLISSLQIIVEIIFRDKHNYCRDEFNDHRVKRV